MTKEWHERTKREQREYMNLTQALYSANPEPIIAKAPKKPKIERSLDNPTESLIQQKIVSWARNMGLPLISIPNHGKRSAWGGQREVMMGLTKGVSDLFLARPKNGKGGMWIELKSRGRVPTFEQTEWLYHMRDEGYEIGWFDNVADAQEAIIRYLGMR